MRSLSLNQSALWTFLSPRVNCLVLPSNEIINRLNLKPGEIVFIGDDFENDIDGSSKVGIIPVHYDPYDLSDFVGLKINDLINLSSLLETLS